MRDFTTDGVQSAYKAITDECKPGTVDDRRMGELLDEMERDGYCALGWRESRHGHSFIVSADPEWFKAASVQAEVTR